MNNNKYPLWEKRFELPRLNPILALIFILAITGLCALTALGLGGLPSTGVAGAAFAFLLLTVRNPLPALALPLSFLAAYLISGDLLSSLSSLLFVPAGVLLAYTVFTNRSLSASVVALTAIIIVSMAAYLTLAVTQIYGESIKESYLALGADIKEQIFEIFRLFSYEDPQGKEVFALSDEVISNLMETSVMLLPSCIVMVCQLIAYGSAKLVKLFSHIFGFDHLFCDNPYHVTLSAPAGAIFIISYAISFLSIEASVVAYSALNLTYIIMPLAAIAGFHYIFGKDGFFRSVASKKTRIIFIVTCAVCIFMSPFSVVPLLAMFGSFGSVGKAVGTYIKNKKSKTDNNND